MYTLSALTLFFCAISPSLSIPPPDFGFPEAPNDTALTLTYQNGGSPVVVAEADLFGLSIPSQEPTVAVNPAGFESIATYNGSYMLIMVDPDARYPEAPTLRFILHWLQTDLTTAPQAADGTTQLVNTTAARAAYRGPGPPTNSSAHRYIVYAYFQPPDFTIPPAFEGYNNTNRTNFNLEEFVDQANLGRPAAAMYFFASNQTGVPADFSAAAGSTYPGGNGNMITAGPGPSITATSTSASATASTTGPATSPTFTGDAARQKAGLGMLAMVGAGALLAL